MDFEITQFEPGKAELTALVKQYEGLYTSEIADVNQYKEIKKARIDLRDIRIKISKKGKSLRDDANQFAKAVIAKEKECIEITSPLEEKFKQAEQDYLERLEIEKRKEQLGERKQMLKGLAEMSDQEILKLNDTEFSNKIIELQKEKLEREQEEKRKREQEERRKKEIEEAEKRAKKQVEKEKQKEIDQLKQEKEDRERQEQLEKERKQKQEAKMKKDQEYKKFLKQNNYNEKTDILKTEGKVVTIYRKVSSFILD